LTQYARGVVSAARNDADEKLAYEDLFDWSMSAMAILRQLNMKPANRRDERFSLLGSPRERRVSSERNGDQRRDDGGDVDEEVFPGMCRVRYVDVEHTILPSAESVWSRSIN
jgi:hypothetical protein